MLIYVCVKAEQQQEREQAKKIMQMLARDIENTYICAAFTFDYLPPPDMQQEADRDIMREDLICACDKMIVATELTEDILRDIEFAKNIKIPIEYI